MSEIQDNISYWAARAERLRYSLALAEKQLNAWTVKMAVTPTPDADE